MELIPGEFFDDVRDAVAAFLAHPKQLAGSAMWRDGNRDGEKRASYAVQIDGVHVGASLNLTAYPTMPVGPNDESRFTIGLNLERCIWRIDFEKKVGGHFNPLDRANHINEFSILGPHYHAWSDNVYLARKTSLPVKLLCARSLPPQIRRWDQAYRWFCNETNIELPHGSVIDLPPRDTLL